MEEEEDVKTVCCLWTRSPHTHTNASNRPTESLKLSQFSLKPGPSVRWRMRKGGMRSEEEEVQTRRNNDDHGGR